MDNMNNMPNQQQEYSQDSYGQQQMYGQTGYQQQPGFQQDMYGQQGFQQPGYQQQPGFQQNPYAQQQMYQQDPYSMPMYSQPMGNTAMPGMNRQQFFRSLSGHKMGREIRSSAIILYVIAGLNFLLGVLALTGTSYLGSRLSFLDAFINLGLGLGIQLGKSRTCAIIDLVYWAVSAIFGLIMFHRFTGILGLVAAIFAVVYTFKIHSAWKLYKETGVYPM